jgi:hypothetical protein
MASRDENLGDTSSSSSRGWCIVRHRLSLGHPRVSDHCEPIKDGALASLGDERILRAENEDAHTADVASCESRVGVDRSCQGSFD